jgi:hypothetical protein
MKLFEFVLHIQTQNIFPKNHTQMLYKIGVSSYNKSRVKSSFHKLYGRNNDLVCDYKLSLAYMLNHLFHTLC